MSRQKAFSEDEVLEGVADVFTANGYKGTSVQMLADACGLGKQSLYNSFGDKQNLYLKAVDCAAARFGSIADEMAQAPDGRRAIQVFFERLLCLCLSPEPAEHACIVSNGLLEGVAEPRIADALRGKWAGSHALLKMAVQRGQTDGSLTNRDDPEHLADLLMTLMAGLRVSARALADAARLQHTIACVLSLLDERPPTTPPRRG